MVKPLSGAQTQLLKTLMLETSKTRAKITTYRGGDEKLALFRVHASNRLLELAKRVACKQQLTKDLRDYFKRWASDAKGGIGGLFREHIADLERVSGRKINLD